MFDDLTEEEAILLAAKYIASEQSVPDDLSKLLSDEVKDILYGADRSIELDQSFCNTRQAKAEAKLPKEFFSAKYSV